MEQNDASRGNASSAPRQPISRDEEMTRMIHALSTFFAIDVTPSAAHQFLPALRLCDTDGVTALLSQQPPDMVHETDRVVSGVMTAKVYGAFPVGVIFAASVFDVLLPIDLSTVHVIPGAGHGFRFSLSEAAVRRAAHSGDGYLGKETSPAARRERLRAHLAALFETHVAAVFASLQRVTSADLRSMWSLLATNIKTMYLRGRMTQYRRQLGLSSRVVDRFDADESCIFSHGSDGPFPSRDRNPLVQATRLFTPPADLGEPMYLRTKCCLRYRIRVNGEPVPYCGSCPRITDAERLRILESQTGGSSH